MINIKNLEPNSINMNEKSCKNLLIYFIGYVTPNRNLLINKMNEYIEEHNRNKYLTLFHTYESKDAPKKYEKLWRKIKNLIRSINSNLDGYYEKYEDPVQFR